MSNTELNSGHNFSREPLNYGLADTRNIGFAVPQDSAEPLMRLVFGMTHHTDQTVLAVRASDVIEALSSGQKLHPDVRHVIFGSAEELSQVESLIARSPEDGETFRCLDSPGTGRTGGSYAIGLPEELHEATQRLVEHLDSKGRYVVLDAGELVTGFDGGSSWVGTGTFSGIIIGTQADVDSALTSISRAGGSFESLSESSESADTAELTDLATP